MATNFFFSDSASMFFFGLVCWFLLRLLHVVSDVQRIFFTNLSKICFLAFLTWNGAYCLWVSCSRRAHFHSFSFPSEAPAGSLASVCISDENKIQSLQKISSGFHYLRIDPGKNHLHLLTIEYVLSRNKARNFSFCNFL